MGCFQWYNNFFASFDWWSPIYSKELKMKITFKEARKLIASKVNGCEQFGTDKLAELINRAEEMAWSSGLWYGIKACIDIRADEGRIVLPEPWGVLEGINVNGVPRQINSEWYQFSPNGVGSDVRCDYWADALVEEEVPTVWMIHEGEQVGVKAKVPEDANCYVTIQGTNTDGNTIYRYFDETNCRERIPGSDLGEKLAVQCDGIVKTYNYFANNGITNIFKPVTRGPIQVFAVGPRYIRKLVELPPSQTQSSLRAYRLPGVCSECNIIQALVKKSEPVVYTQDSEVLQIESKNALISLCLAAYYKWEKFDPEKSQYFFVDGINTLNGQIKEKNGGAQRQIQVWGQSYARDKCWNPRSY
jgi:hypothetical protein